MTNYVAHIYSTIAHGKQAADGNILRHVSTIGHAAKVVQKLATEDDFVLGKVAKATCDTLSAASKDNKLLQIAGKGIKIAKYTDPITCLCGMIRVGKSDSPGRKFIEESSALLGMFLVEGSMIKYAKNIANIKGVKQVNDALVNFSKNTKYCSQIPAIVYGTLFTIGSEVGTNLFGKAGKWVADKLGLAPETKEEKPQVEKPKKEYYWG